MCFVLAKPPLYRPNSEVALERTISVVRIIPETTRWRVGRGAVGMNTTTPCTGCGCLPRKKPKYRFHTLIYFRDSDREGVY